MNELQFARVNELPALPQRKPYTVYFVASGTSGMEIYVTGKNVAEPRHLAASGGGVSDWADLLGKPTTIAGYGITDAASLAQLQLKADTADLSLKADLTYVDAALHLKSNIVDVLNILATMPTNADMNAALASKSDTTHTHTFASLTSKPTTLAGYGITDGATVASVQLKASIVDVANGLAGKADASHTHAFADLTSKPTTLAGFGITDGATAASVQLKANITDVTTGLAGKADANAVVDLSNNQSVNGKKTLLREIVLANLLNDPGSLSAGMMWYNSTEGAVKTYIGGQVTTLYRLTVGDPSTLSAGVMFYDLLTDTLKLRKGSTTVTLSDSTHTHTFASLTSLPTTLAGYGITDALKSGTAGVKVTVATTAPSSPATNDLWVDIS